jgi:hypothetical protein
LPVIEAISGGIRAVLVEFPCREELAKYGALIGILGQIIVWIDQSRLVLNRDLIAFTPVLGELMQQRVPGEYAGIHGNRNAREGLLSSTEELS